MKKLILTLIISLQLQTAFAGAVITVDTTQFKEILAANKKNKVLFFFTSWCTCCKPVSLSKDLPKEKIIFVSLDNEKEAIENFAKEMQYDTYYIKPDDKFQNIAQLSSDLGIKLVTTDENNHVSSHYPHIAYLDSNNKVITDNIAKEDINKYFE
jgi:hypothetical protein